MISYTGEPVSLTRMQILFGNFKAAFTEKEAQPVQSELTCIRKNEGFVTSGQVQYVAQTGNFRRKGFAFTGALSILKVALSYDYLWMNLRVKGGAYGCMSGFKRNGDSYFVSYRDPHMKRTLEVYKGIADYVRSFEADEREMTKYIIGTISNKDVPKTPQMKGSFAKNAYFCGVTEEMLQKDRDEILTAQQEDIRALAPLIEAILEDGSICVVGSETVIEKNKNLLKEVKRL
jgi:Zn-dependent M16 (insulinase) family peptidase